MSQIPIDCSASVIQELFASGQTPIYELTEEKSLDELMAEFGWTEQRQPRTEEPDHLRRSVVNPHGDKAGAW
ncbi:hypothetical protein [Paucidesulfovibrio longus]|uniref:hypothetical protein n=1 Tax=Paucidesulfovibrio longus TaxID=889 RepID=UPI0003B49582|nr:hypothetical protein [Paucidesulfovibrio longus]